MPEEPVSVGRWTEVHGGRTSLRLRCPPQFVHVCEPSLLFGRIHHPQGLVDGPARRYWIGHRNKLLLQSHSKFRLVARGCTLGSSCVVFAAYA